MYHLLRSGSTHSLIMAQCIERSALFQSNGSRICPELRGPEFDPRIHSQAKSICDWKVTFQRSCALLTVDLTPVCTVA